MVRLCSDWECWALVRVISLVCLGMWLGANGQWEMGGFSVLGDVVDAANHVLL